MNLYLDTSSLFKLYVEEPGSEAVKALCSAAVTISVSLIAYAEFRGSLARAYRSARLGPNAYRATVELFQRDWPDYSVREVTEDLVHLAGDLAEKHYLRGFAAIHLASAVALEGELGEPVTFSASDGRLLEAAVAEGLALAPDATL